MFIYKTQLDKIHPVGLLWTRDQLVTEVTTYTTNKKHNSGIQTLVAAFKRLQTQALNFMATTIGENFHYTFHVNLLKPTGHVMHQQFNIQQLYVLPTLYLSVLYLSENKQRLVPLIS